MREFLDRDALTNDFRRELRLCQLLPVLGLDLRDVDVGADLERQPEGHVAVIGAGRVVVEEIVDAGNLQLNDAGNGIGHGLSAGTGVIGVDLDDRRRYLGKLRDGQGHHCHEADHHDHDREDRGKDRPVDEKPRAHLDASVFFGSGA